MSEDEDAIFGDYPPDAEPVAGFTEVPKGYIIYAAPVFNRLSVMRNTHKLAPREGDVIYGGPRTNLVAVARRFLAGEFFRGLVDAREFEEIALVRILSSGAWDDQLAETYHERAKAEYYYRHEKDYR